VKKPQPKIENIEEPLDILKEEEVITKDHKKIHLSRFDLFDEDEE
jgi:topoisomerase-4 subunit A